MRTLGFGSSQIGICHSFPFLIIFIPLEVEGVFLFFTRPAWDGFAAGLFSSERTPGVTNISFSLDSAAVLLFIHRFVFHKYAPVSLSPNNYQVDGWKENSEECISSPTPLRLFGEGGENHTTFTDVCKN